MKVYHVTHRKNLNAIRKEGLLVEKAKNQLWPMIWLCSQTRLAWAKQHVICRHGWKYKDIRTIKVDVNKYFIVRAGRGLYRSDIDIDSVKILYVIEEQE